MILEDIFACSNRWLPQWPPYQHRAAANFPQGDGQGTNPTLSSSQITKLLTLLVEYICVSTCIRIWMMRTRTRNVKLPIAYVAYSGLGYSKWPTLRDIRYAMLDTKYNAWHSLQSVTHLEQKGNANKKLRFGLMNNLNTYICIRLSCFSSLPCELCTFMFIQMVLGCSKIVLLDTVNSVHCSEAPHHNI